MNDDVVSIIIPAFNAERHLADALTSARAQTYAPTELIVIDDGSTDRTAEIAGQFEGVVVLQQPNRGAPAARNAGVASATGTFLAFLDSDDMFPRDKLAVQMDHLRTHPEVGCVFGTQEIFTSDGAVDSSWMEELPEWMRWAPNWEHRGQIQPMSMVVRRSVFDAVGSFDERLRVSDDVDWVLRATEAGIVMAVVNDVVLHRRAHDTNISRDEAGRRRDHFLLLKARIDRRRAAT